ncbi:MAG TPA: NDP-sugar synthase [Gaiellaceae bacterium]|nr:NDP-sugar synthase [Gaiellaceae bacterium]
MSLPAVILVGGQGTRLRPLTDRTRKDMLPLVDRPLLAYTFEHLQRHGVERAVLSCGYLPTQLEDFFGDEWSGFRLEYRVEAEPLGTGGAVRFAAEGIGESFYAVNGDSLREADLGALADFHHERGAKATILLTPVADPTRYGLVRLAGDGKVKRFLEKPRPEEIDTNLINAGVYVLEPEVLDLIPPDRPVSIEREVFPQLVEQGACYGLALDGYWLDVGTPESYLQAHRDVLERNFETEVGDLLGRDYTYADADAAVEAEARLVPPVYVGGSVAAGARIGSVATIGRGATVAAGALVENAVIGPGARIGRGAVVVDSIVGADAVVGEECAVRGMSIVGPGARIGARNTLDGGIRVAADAVIPDGALTFA